MCYFPFLVVWERCGCTAYRVMETCSDAGSGVFAICCKSLYEATHDEEILEQTWEMKSGGCPLCYKYVVLFEMNSLIMLELTMCFTVTSTSRSRPDPSRLLPVTIPSRQTQRNEIHSLCVPQHRFLVNSDISTRARD